MKMEQEKRLELQAILESILGSKHVYFQSSSSKMSYPAIKYSRNDILIDKANNANYRKTTRYKIIVIDEDPDSELINKILELPMCSFDTHYVVENLNHDVFTLYY